MQLKNLFSSSTFRQSAVTFLGTVINGALGAFFYIIAARFLGPAQFGLFTIAVLVLTMVSDVGDLGTDTGLVRFVGKHRKENPQKANRFLKLGLEIKIVVSLFVAAVGWFLAPWVATFFFGKPELSNLLRISFLGVSGALLFSFIIRGLQAFEKFWLWSWIQISANAIRILLVLGLFLSLRLSTSSLLGVYALVPLIGFVAGLFLLGRNFLKVKGEFLEAKDFFHYNKWVALFALIAAFSGRLDSFMSARFLSIVEVGIYGAATQLVQIVPQLVNAISTVVAPKIAGMGTKTELIIYLKKVQLFVLGIAFLGILAIPLVVYLIPVLYGQAYVASVPVFIILLFAMLVFLISIPVHNAVFYYFSYPKLFVWISLGYLAIIATIGFFLIPRFGITAAAASVLLGNIFNFIVPAVWVLKKLHKR